MILNLRHMDIANLKISLLLFLALYDRTLHKNLDKEAHKINCKMNMPIVSLIKSYTC